MSKRPAEPRRRLMTGSEPVTERYIDVVVPRAVRSLFTYAIPDGMMAEKLAGRRAIISFGKRKVVGLLAHRRATVEREVKEVLGLVDDEPVVSEDLLSLGLWVARYYFSNPGDLFGALLPRDEIRIETVITFVEGVSPPVTRSSNARALYSLLAEKKSRRFDQLQQEMGLTVATLTRLLKSPAVVAFAGSHQKSRRVAIRERPYAPAPSLLEPESVALTEEQRSVYENIAPQIGCGRFSVSLLHGVTGSGKTEVYAHLIRETLAQGKKALALAPEIALVDLLARRFEKRLGVRAAILHSELTPRQRYAVEKRIRSGEVSLVVGARSAVFAPLDNLGLVIVDEEHDSSYKQDSAPRYQGRDVAIKRAADLRIPVVLGSATPSLESYHHARNGRYELLTLTKRIDGRLLPVVVTQAPEKPGEVGERLATEIAKRLDAGEQTLLFINRRGSARFVQCSACGHVFECRNCSLSLVLHKRMSQLRCHTCGYEESAPDICPACHQSDFFEGGTGSEKVETWVRETFPEARVARMDRDTTRKRGSTGALLAAMERREIDILIGTQMIAKGHDFPGVTLVGGVSADDALHLPDFRASERMFQALSQSSGRAGRGDTPGLVVVQTFSREHHSVAAAALHDYAAFYDKEAPLRQMAMYPPYCRMAVVRIDSASKPRGERFVRSVEKMVGPLMRHTSGLVALGPIEAVVFRTRNRFNWRLLFKAPGHGALGVALEDFLERIEKLSSDERRGVMVTINRDPDTML